MQKYPFIYPHELISYLINDLGVHMSQDSVTRYWVHAQSTGQPFAVHSPGDTSCIPLGLYGDGARLATGEVAGVVDELTTLQATVNPIKSLDVVFNHG